jgi:hypothetical protein
VGDVHGNLVAQRPEAHLISGSRPRD